MFRDRASGERRPPRLTKAAALLHLAVRNPVEAYDRLRAVYEVKAARLMPTAVRYEPVTWNEFAEHARGIASAASWRRDDEAFLEIYRRVEDRVRALGPVPFPAQFDADPLLARLAYLTTRALQPEVVIETGVGLGVVSSCILYALEQNGGGRLVSLDLPPLGVAGGSVGRAVPEALRARWTILYGSSTRLLAPVVAVLPPVGLFVHDSLFTARNSREEYAAVAPRLGRPSAVIANAVQQSGAFRWLIEQHQPCRHAVLAAEEKSGEFVGVGFWQESSPGTRNHGRATA